MNLRQAPSELILPGLEMVTLWLPGPIPTKKNKLRPRMGGGRGQMYDPETKGKIAALATVAAIQWGARAPLVHPDVTLGLEYVDGTQDRDGIWTTILDALKQASVIADDSIRCFNGTVIQTPAVLADHLKASVSLTFPTSVGLR